MLIHYRENGFIDIIQSDPDDESLANLMAMGGYIHLPSLPLPEVSVRDKDGKVIIEDGKVKKQVPGYTTPEVTHDSHMVKDGKVVERVALAVEDVTIKADGVDTYSLKTPKGSVLKLDGKEITVKDGKIEFSTEDAGVYVFSCGFPLVEARWKVTAS